MRIPLRRGSRSALAAACALVPVVLFSTAGTGLAQQMAAPASPGNLVTIDVQDAPLESVIAMLRQRTAMGNFVIDGKGFRPVTLALVDKPMDAVMRIVAVAAGATLTKEDDIYYIRPKGEAAKPEEVKVTTPTTPDSNSSALLPDTGDAAVPQPTRRVRSKPFVKITLQFLKPSDFVKLLRDPEILTEDNGPFDEARHADWRRNIAGYGATLTPPPPNAANENSGYNLTPLQQGQTPATGVGGFGAGRTDSPFDTAGQRGGGGGGRGGGGRGGGGGALGAPGGGGPGGGGVGGQGQNATNLLPDGVDPPIAYDVDNSLLVRGDPEGLEELRSIIRLLDIPAKQLMIKAEFVEVDVSDVESFGIQWTVKPAGNVAVALPAGADASAGSLNLIYAAGNAVANLRAQSTRNINNILQAPIVTTTNLVQASVAIGNQVPQFTTTTTIANNGAVITSPTVIGLPVTNGFFVTPRINGDNSITMFLQPQLQAATAITGPGGIIFQQISFSQVTALRRVQNGETMVIGGFINKTETFSANGTPILKDLPIIGPLFRTRNRNTQGSETLVFITPTILEDRQTGSVGAVQSPPTP